MTFAMFGIAILFGGALNFFKFPILFPAFGVAALAVAIGGFARNEGIGAVLLMIAFVAAALQIGYLLAAVMRAFVASRHRHAQETRAMEGVGFR
jgi:hypothetical protein